MLRVEMAGQVFGRLTVKEFSHSKNVAHWLCACVCGGEVVVARNNLLNGNVKSCGCYRSERAAEVGRNRIKHGHRRAGVRRTATYTTWEGMVQRCTNPQHESYYMYGGRGIEICEAWRTFENFLADMGERPKDRTIDRKDSNGNYEPGNCRWATVEEQNANKAARGTHRK